MLIRPLNPGPQPNPAMCCEVPHPHPPCMQRQSHAAWIAANSSVVLPCCPLPHLWLTTTTTIIIIIIISFRSIIWYMAMDPLKWLLMWILNEEGARSQRSWKKYIRSKAPAPQKSGEENIITVGPAAANYTNPLGRASMQTPDAETLSRASIIKVGGPPEWGSVYCCPAAGCRDLSCLAPVCLYCWVP